MDVNALFYHACKNGCIRLSATLKEMLFSLKKDATLKEMLFSLKKDAIVVSICWNQTFIPLQKIQLIVWWEILEVHHMLLHFFSLHTVFCTCFLCIECTTPVIIIFVDHNSWMSSCFVLAQDRTP